MNFLPEESAVRPGEEGFIRAIDERPADETTWLIYADWLGETGNGERELAIRLWLMPLMPLLRALFETTPASAPRWAVYRLKVECLYQSGKKGHKRRVLYPKLTYGWCAKTPWFRVDI